MWQRFNESSRSAILRAQQEASRDLRAQAVETRHLFSALLADESNGAFQILEKQGVTSGTVRDRFAIKRVDILPTSDVEEIAAEFKVDGQLIRQIEARLLHKLRSQNEELKLSDGVKRVLELAADEARETHNIVQGSTEIGSEHLLLGLLRLEDSETRNMLSDSVLALESVRASVLEYLRSVEKRAD